MGGEAWNYFVPFEASVEAAMERLKRQVFASGQYNGSDDAPATMEEAFAVTSPDGTRSILDMMGVSEEPDYCAVCRLPDADLDRLFGTTRPTHEMVAGSHELYDDIERGQGIYIVVYDGDRPSELFFAGYSFD